MIKASEVKELREKTGAGMLDCKKALEANNGDMQASIDWLREKGIAKAAKKESRVAAEGLCGIKVEGNKAVIIEVNSETDFVAKNDNFIEFVDYLETIILNNEFTSVEEVLEFKDKEETISDKLVALTAKIGEKISFRRFEKLVKEDNQVFGEYKHMGGRIGVLMLLDGTNPEIAKDVAMHVAAMNPIAATREEVDPEVVAKEAHIIKEQVMAEGKPADIAEKMVAGRLNKFYKEMCLEEQSFVKDSNLSVAQYVKANDSAIKLMVRFAVGEGIEKAEDNFAEEVMKQVNNA